MNTENQNGVIPARIIFFHQLTVAETIMQTLTQVLLFGFSLGLATSAAAEHFNDNSRWVTSNGYPEPSSEARTYASISSEFNESNRTTKGLFVSSKGPILCSVDSPWSKASGDPYQIPDRFNDKYSNRC